MAESEVIQLVSGYVENSNNIYDLYIQVFTYLRKKQSTAIRSIEENIDEFINYKNQVDNILENCNFKSLMSEKNKYDILELLKRSDEYILVLLAVLFSSIDEIFGNQYYRHAKEESDLLERVEVLGCLNTDKTVDLGKVYYKTGSLLERLYSEDDFIRSNDQTEDTIIRYQKNFLIYEEPKTDYEICLSRIKCPYINGNLSKKNHPLRIALVPLTGDQKYVEFVSDGKKVSLKNLNNVEKYKQKILNVLVELKTKEVNIVIFPEMVFSEDILMCVRKYLKENKGQFALVISGSIWRDRKNQCAIISGDGIELTRQLKYNPYHKTIYFNKFGNNEGIYVTSENKIINIMDIINIGRFATPICADFISDDYYNELQKIGVNLSFVPAYTPSLSAFKTKASQLGSANWGCSFICNCCIPMVDRQSDSPKKKCEVSFVNVPLKNEKKSGSNIMKLCNHIDGACNYGSDRTCYFMVSFLKNTCEFKHIKV